MGDSEPPATGRGPRIAVVGEPSRDLAEAAEDAGVRLLAREPNQLHDVDAVLWLDEPDAAEPVVEAAGRGGAGLVVGLDEQGIDGWGFAVGKPKVALAMLDDPHVLLDVALHVSRRSATAVRERDDDAVRRLRALGDEVARIAAALGALDRAGPDSAVADRRLDFRSEGDARAVSAAAVRGMIRARRVRDRHFPDLFADPAWDILLDLLAARMEGRMVAVSSLCIAAAVPSTTALRWIAAMTERGLLERRSDPTDRRRVFIALSDDAARRTQDCVAAVLANGAPVA